METDDDIDWMEVEHWVRALPAEAGAGGVSALRQAYSTPTPAYKYTDAQAYK
jgi:hypothetical protein